MLFSSRRTVVKRPYGRIPGPVPAALSTLGHPSIQDPCRRQRRRLKRGGGTVSLMTGGSLALSGGGPRGRAAKSSPAAHPLPCLRRTVTSASVLDPCCPTVAGPWSSAPSPRTPSAALVHVGTDACCGPVLRPTPATLLANYHGHYAYALSSSSCILVAGRSAISVLIDDTT